MEATGAADDAVVVVTMREDALSETMILTVNGLDHPNMTATTDPVAGLNAMMTIDAIVIETENEKKNGAVREVPDRLPRARHPNHNLLRMNVIGEPSLFSNLLHAFELKS